MRQPLSVPSDVILEASDADQLYLTLKHFPTQKQTYNKLGERAKQAIFTYRDGKKCSLDVCDLCSRETM